MVAAVLAAVVLLVVHAGSPAASRTPSAPASLVPVPPHYLRFTVSDPAARQLSHGRWSAARTPVDGCGAAASAWVGHELVVIDARHICHAAAASRISRGTSSMSSTSIS
jgi:hypothetical protein